MKLLSFAILGTLCITALVALSIQSETNSYTEPRKAAGQKRTKAPNNNPKELGQVHWSRDFVASTKRAKKQGKPLFVLFQEVPGCSTCVGFGNEVLSDPKLVAQIESDFVPVAVYNNLGGKDAALLKRFGEPSWNNPVVRFLDSEGNDLIPRKSGVWARKAIASRMSAALAIFKKAAKKKTASKASSKPSRTANSVESATVSMACFWTGEACLGSIAGVVETQASFLGGREVVDISYDGDAISYSELMEEIKTRGCARSVDARGKEQTRAAQKFFKNVRTTTETSRRAPSSDQKYYLRHSKLRHLDLTPLQRVKVNAALGRGQDAGKWLTSEQKSVLNKE